MANVLVLDDDANVLSAFESFFRTEKHSMVAARTPEEAMGVLQEQRIDLLITDVRLQWRSGVTFLLKAKAMYSHLPIIVITGYAESISREEVQTLGADYFFLKPLDLEKLRSAVSHCLDKKRGTPNTRSTRPRYHERR